MGFNWAFKGLREPQISGQTVIGRMRQAVCKTYLQILTARLLQGLKKAIKKPARKPVSRPPKYETQHLTSIVIRRVRETVKPNY